LELEIVAEGIETEAQAKFLASLEVQAGQDFSSTNPPVRVGRGPPAGFRSSASLTTQAAAAEVL
jgi:EAL domain-containing protein (putative c-di-GMP-specific phosphodiesterase class I)